MVDPYDLQRFVRAQEHDYEEALSEIRNGRKRSHWMWYIFPQFAGLGVSPTSKQYAVKSVAEARAFLAQSTARAAVAGVRGSRGPHRGPFRHGHLRLSGRHEAAILRNAVRLSVSCGSVFHRVIDRFFAGEPDAQTLRLIAEVSEHL
jgi:uncharacterized protein (DUF1810 family)